MSTPAISKANILLRIIQQIPSNLREHLADVGPATSHTDFLTLKQGLGLHGFFCLRLVVGAVYLQRGSCWNRKNLSYYQLHYGDRPIFVPVPSSLPISYRTYPPPLPWGHWSPLYRSETSSQCLSKFTHQPPGNARAKQRSVPHP